MRQSDLEDWADWSAADAMGQLKPFQYPKWWQFIKKRQMRKEQAKLLKKMARPWPLGFGGQPQASRFHKKGKK